MVVPKRWSKYHGPEHISYRQLSGSIKRILGHNAPAYNMLHRRMQKLDVKINNGRITVHDKSLRLTLIADSTGLKQHNRGEWIRHKWKKRRGFAKAHLMIDADTMKVLAYMLRSTSFWPKCRHENVSPTRMLGMN